LFPGVCHLRHIWQKYYYFYGMFLRLTIYDVALVVQLVGRKALLACLTTAILTAFCIVGTGHHLKLDHIMVVKLWSSNICKSRSTIAAVLSKPTVIKLIRVEWSCYFLVFRSINRKMLPFKF
jgi:hypothetical protein